MRRATWILLLVVMTAGALRAAPTDEARRLVAEGLKLLAKGDAEGALARFRDAQVELPESARLHYDVGLALYRLERWDEAGKAFELAAASGDREIEKRARLQLGNCAIKEGRFERALEELNRALEIDADYEDARANREWVIRKIAELARKKAEQEEKQKQERRFIEKLQEIVGAQTRAHLAVRGTMRRQALEVRPTRIERLSEILDAAPAEGEELPPALDEAALAAFFEGLRAGQGEIREQLAALVEEGRAKVAAAANAADPSALGADPATPPADPDLAKIEKALPFLEAALPLLARATDAAETASWSVHAAQEQALFEMLRALDELLDELTRIIQDEVQLLKDTAALERRAGSEDESERIDEAETRDRAIELRTRQEGLRERTRGVARQVETMVQSAPAAAPSGAPGAAGGGTPVGQDPAEAKKRMEEALGHLLAGRRSHGERLTGARDPGSSRRPRPRRPPSRNSSRRARRSSRRSRSPVTRDRRATRERRRSPRRRTARASRSPRRRRATTRPRASAARRTPRNRERRKAANRERRRRRPR
ncbi:MAG: hypothetical protein R3F20_07535 [Planctomycetota bacterium]